MHTCGDPCPDLPVACDSRPHQPGVAHHANGTAPDGTRWSLFWWRPGDGAETPAVPASAPRPEGGFPGAGVG